MHVVKPLDLVLAVEKQPRKLSIWFIEASFTTGTTGLSRKASEPCMRTCTEYKYLSLSLLYVYVDFNNFSLHGQWNPLL